MSNLNFIADVIYGLKVEYGEPVTIGMHDWTTNQQTGVKTDNPQSFQVAMCIPLPENLREAFLRSIGQKMEGRLQKGQREFLLDKSDIPPGQSIIENRSWIDFNCKRHDVQQVNDYVYALSIIAQAVTGNPKTP